MKLVRVGTLPTHPARLLNMFFLEFAEASGKDLRASQISDDLPGVSAFYDGQSADFST